MHPAHSDAIRFRRSTRADLVFVVTIEAEAAKNRFVSSWRPEQHAAVFDNPERLHLIIESSETAEPVGFMILGGIGSPNRAIEFRRIVIGPKGRGIGRQAVRLLKKFAFEDLNAHRLWLDVKDFNAHARALYLSEGFVEEGVMRDCLASPDGFESLVLMSILEPEYRSQPAADTGP